MIGNETDEIIEDFFYSFLQRYQKDLEKSMTGSEFVFDTFDLLYYKFQRISPDRGASYVDPPIG